MITSDTTYRAASLPRAGYPRDGHVQRPRGACSAPFRGVLLALVAAASFAGCGGSGGSSVAELLLEDMPASFCCAVPAGETWAPVGTIHIDPDRANPLVGEGVAVSIDQVEPAGALAFRWSGSFIAGGREDPNDGGILKDFDPAADVGGFRFNLAVLLGASLEVRARDCGFAEASFVLVMSRYLEVPEPGGGIVILGTRRQRVEIVNECPEPPPPADAILFARTAPGEPGEIWMTHPAGGETQLTSDVHSDIDPAWSPDRTRVAFTSDSAEAGIYELYTMDTDGGNVQPATAFGDRWVEDPAWSPDGTMIAMVVGLPGMPDKDLWVVNVDEPLGPANPRQLTEGGARDASPSWSPDGDEIAFIRDGDIHVVPADGSAPPEPVVAGVGATAVDWSPQGGLAFSRYDVDFLAPRIWRADADGGNPVRVTDGVEGFADLAPSWSPDGSRIAFVREDARAEVRTGVVHTVGADGADPQAVPGQDGDNRDPDW